VSVILFVHQTASVNRLPHTFYHIQTPSAKLSLPPGTWSIFLDNVNSIQPNFDIPPTQNPTKLLIVGDSPAIGTGMAEVIRLVFENLIRCFPSDYEIRQIGLFHIYRISNPHWFVYPTKLKSEVNGMVLDPDDAFGLLSLVTVTNEWRPDIVFYFNDPQYAAAVASIYNKGYKLIVYTNYDGIPFFQCDTPLGSADHIVTMSHFALDIFRRTHPSLAKAKSSCIYSPSDATRFRPVEPMKRSELRADLLPSWIPRDAIILGWVGRNCWRKQVWVVFKVLRYLRYGGYFVCPGCDRIQIREWNSQLGEYDRSGPDSYTCNCGSVMFEASPLSNVFLWVHMQQDDTLAAWPTGMLEKLYSVHAGRDLFYTEGYNSRSGLATDQMANLYQMFDLLLYLSGGEGFGVPVWEAMSCGIPVVYTDYSSHAELVRNAKGGLPVMGTLQPQAGDGVQRLIADIPSALVAIRTLIANPTLRNQLGTNGRQYTEQFSIETQVSKWHCLFQGTRR